MLMMIHLTLSRDLTLMIIDLSWKTGQKEVVWIGLELIFCDIIAALRIIKEKFINGL